MPETAEGQTFFRLAIASIRPGLAGAEMDGAGLVAMAMACGIPPAVATEWLAAFSAGMHAGRAELAARESHQHPDQP